MTYRPAVRPVHPLLEVLPALLLAWSATPCAAAAAVDPGGKPAVVTALEAAEESLRSGELQVAESRYREVLGEGWLLLGRLAAADGDLERAAVAFEKASRATVERRRATEALALVELERGEGESAVRRLQGLLADAPGDVGVRRLLAAALAASGRPAQAVQELAEAHALAPDDAELVFALAAARLGAGEVDAAARLFDRLVALRPIPATRVLVGRTYRDFGEYARARSALEAALAEDPRLPRAHFYLATLHLLSEGTAELDAAIAELERELAVSPDDPVANLYLGLALVEARRYEAALAPLEIARRGPGTVVDADHFLGRALLGLERPREAVVALDRALAAAQAAGDADPEQLRSIQYELGLALRRSGDAAGAREHLAAAGRQSAGLTTASRDRMRRYLEGGDDGGGYTGPIPRFDVDAFADLAPEERAGLRAQVETMLARAYLNLGVLQTQTGAAGRAAGLFASAAELAPELPQVQRALGGALYQAGEHRRAVAHLSRALREAPGDVELRRMLGLSHLELGEYDEAIDLLSGDPSAGRDPALDYAYGLALARSGRVAEAESAFARLLARHADSAPIHVVLGQANAQQNDYPAAERHLRRALELDPAVADAWSALGMIQLRRGELAEAEASFRAELARRPDDAVTRFRLATVLDLGSRPDEALAELRRVLELRPGDADARYLLGKVLLAGGAAEEALAELQTAAELAPADPNVRYQLGRAYQALGRTDEAGTEFAAFRDLKRSRREDAP